MILGDLLKCETHILNTISTLSGSSYNKDDWIEDLLLVIRSFDQSTDVTEHLINLLIKLFDTHVT